MAVKDTGLLTRNARSEFFNQFNATPTYYQDLATRIPSTRDVENYRWLGTVPQVREWGGGRLAKGLRSEAYNVTNLKYESTLEVDEDELADDQTGQINIRVREMAQRAATHKDYLIADLLIHGGTAGFVAYDGLTFFNDAHVSGASGSQDNDLTATAANAVKTTAECQTALKAAIGAMLAYVDDQGEPMMLSTSGLAVVCPPSLYLAMSEAVSAGIVISGTAGMANVLQNVVRVISLPWLSLGTTFYLLKTDGIVRPFIFQDREPLVFGSLAEGSEESFKTGKYLYGVKARYRMAYGYWQYAVRTAFNY